MRGLSDRTGIHILGCLALLGGAAVGGLTAGFSAAPERSSTVAARMSPAEIVHLRFPADWDETGSGAASPAMLAFASADGGITLFDPRPTYPIADASMTRPAVEPATPATAALPATPKPTAQVTAAAPAKIALASATGKPVLPAKPRSHAVLNDSQIANIKKRLNLTPDQQRYWPAVEAELRKMEYRKDASAKSSRTASIDMSKVDVDGLKSAGFPLVMSFSDDQRRELKSLAHLLGLDSVMTGF